MDLPIVCTLTESELRERRRTVLEPILETAFDVTPTADGYFYHFKQTADILARLSCLVDLERQCCQFLTFKIIAEAGHKEIGLEVTGPPEAKSIIADYFGGAPKTVVLRSVITCPQCQHTENETMPVNQCVFFYECSSCRARLRPRPGDCCVFCSYGSIKCPLAQSQFV